MTIFVPPLFAALDAVSATPEKPVLPMIVVGGIMVLTYVAIAFDWLHKSLAAMVGAIAAVAAALVLGVFKNEVGHSAYDRAVHDIIGHDIGVIGVIVGTSVLVEVAGRSGLFHFLAVKIVKVTQGDAVRLLVAIAGATMLFVTFLSIAPGSMIVASLALVVTHELKLDPRPYMMTVGLCANSAALMTFASGICTIMLATAGNLPYSHFFFVSTPMAFISAAIALGWIRWCYRGVLVNAASESERIAQVDGFDEWALVKDRRLFYRSAIILGGTILGFASAQRLGIGTDFVAFCGGTAALLFSGIHPDEAIRKVNWSLILFFVGLFVIIGAVQETGLLDLAARQMLELAGGDPIKTMLLIAAFVLALSGVLDNIPVAATLIPLVRSLEAQGLDAVPLWWTLVIAANLGGNSTPIGSVSSVIALNGLEKERGIKVGWGEFFKVGGGVTLLQSVVVLVYLWVYATLGLFPGASPAAGGTP
jgi:Na+/H+ antiporter NhaD/arsenite permease-like protein